MPDKMIGTREASRELRIDKNTLIRWIKQGDAPDWEQLPGPNGAYFISVEKFAAFCAALAELAAAPPADMLPLVDAPAGCDAR